MPEPASSARPPRSRQFKLFWTLLFVVGIIGMVSGYRSFLQHCYAVECRAYLNLIDGVKEQWAQDFHKTNHETPTWSDLAGTNKYLRIELHCLAGGTYSLNPVGEKPTCSYSTNNASAHVLP